MSGDNIVSEMFLFFRLCHLGGAEMAMCNQISARPRKSNHRRLSIHPDFTGLPHGRACPADFRGTIPRQVAELSCLPLSCDAQALPAEGVIQSGRGGIFWKPTAFKPPERLTARIATEAGNR